MELVLIYLATIIISFIFELDNGFAMFKDVADAGYKIDIEQMDNFMKQMKSNQNNSSLLRLLIPIYNLYKAMEIRMQYNQQRFLILDQLSVMDCIEEMTEAEKIEYAKKPTGLNALLIPLKTEIEISKALKFELKEEGALWFLLDEKQQDIKIVKAEGPVAKLPLAEQKQKLKKEYMEMFERIIQQYGTIENFSDDIASTPKNEEGKIVIDITPKSTTEKITDLRKLRDEIIFTIDSDNTKDIDDAVSIEKLVNKKNEENGYQKINRKDK